MKKSLKQVMEISTGCSIRGAIQLVTKIEGDMRLLQMKNIDQKNGVDTSSLSYIKFQGKKPPEYLSKGDIIFVNRGVKFFAVCSNEDIPDVAVSPQLLVLKVREDKKNILLPKYVTWYINHKRAQSFFRKEAVGTAVTQVSKSSLEKMLIDIPGIDKQKLIVKINNLSTKEKQIYKKLLIKKEQLLEKILDNTL